MGAIGNSRATLVDIVKASDPTGRILPIAEILMQYNQVIDDIPWYVSNGPTSNLITVRSSIPTPSWTRINKGTAISKSTTEQVEDTMGVLEATNEVHDLLDYIAAGNLQEFRYKQDMAYLEGFAQTVASAIFYGNEATTPSMFTGLAARYSATTATYGSQITKGGGSGSDNTSIWIIDWGEDSVHGIYPPGSPAGLQTDDMGKVRVTDADSNPFWAWCTRFRWSCGLSVVNYRHVARVCNIDVSDLANAGESGYSGANLINLIIKALHTMLEPGGRQRVIYANETVRSALDLLANNKSTLAVGYREFAGEQVLAFRGIPVRRCDQLTLTEATIS